MNSTWPQYGSGKHLALWGLLALLVTVGVALTWSERSPVDTVDDGNVAAITLQPLRLSALPLDTTAHLHSIGIASQHQGAQSPLSMPWDHVFHPLQSPRDLQQAYTEHVSWLRLQLENDTAETQQAFLRFENPSIGHATLFRQDASPLSSGLLVPVESRAYITRLSSFPVELAAGERADIAIAVSSPASQSLHFRVIDPVTHRLEANRHSFWLTTYFGMLLALAIYNFLLFLGLRDKVFLIYVGFVLSFGIASSTFTGLTPLLFLNPEQLNPYRVVALGYTSSALLGTLFTQAFLRTHLLLPSWHRYLQTVSVFAAIGVVSSLLLPIQPALQLMDLVGLVTCLSLLACGVVAIRERVTGARLFVLAWSLMLIGASAFALRNLGLVPANLLTLYGLQIGSALEMLLLSFALVARFHRLKRQKEAAQNRLVKALREQELHLASKVAERTAELEQMACTDGLTGLLNRSGMTQHLLDMLQRNRRSADAKQQQLVILYMLDLDDFKPVNDIYGHEAGDAVLQEVATRIRAAARRNDGVARFGGDEFIVISEEPMQPAETLNEAIQTFTQRLNDAIARPIMLPDGSEVCVHASIGYAISRGGNTDMDELLKAADTQMYQTKRAKLA